MLLSGTLLQLILSGPVTQLVVSPVIMSLIPAWLHTKWILILKYVLRTLIQDGFLLLLKGCNFLTNHSKAVFLLWIFLFVIYVCLCHTVISLSCSLEVTCWERADLLAFLYVMFSFCSFLLSNKVPWVGRGT